MSAQIVRAQRARRKNAITICGEIAYVQLTKGYVAVIDAADAELVSACRWSASETRGHVYVRTCLNGRFVTMHRLILSATAEQWIDHINGLTLDNRRNNLRLATPSQNLQNQKVRCDSTSGLKGVSKTRSGRYGARIRMGGKTTWLGVFADKAEAGRAYDAAARKRFGEFARLNFPEGHEMGARP